MQSYTSRVVDRELDDLLPVLPAIAIEGARGVGKTTTAKERAQTVFALATPAGLEAFTADEARLTRLPMPVLIDEWQRYPPAFDRIKLAVDDGASAGSYLLTGSPPASGVPVHSGAGRVVVLRMRPMSLVERGMPPTVSLSALLDSPSADIDGSSAVGLDGYVEQIVISGFPGIRGAAPRARRALLDGYVNHIAQRDFPEMGRVVRNPSGLLRWLRAYASATSTTASFETIRDAATAGEGDKPARASVGAYRDVLERLGILEPVPAWVPSRNQIRRLGLTPKHQLVDPALACRLLELSEAHLLTPGSTLPLVPDGSFLGALFESLVTQSVRVYAQAAEASVSHLRTHRGEHEVDLIVNRHDAAVVAIEVKLSASVSDADVRHLTWLKGELGEQLVNAIVITTGERAYRRPDGIAVVPAALLGP